MSQPSQTSHFLIAVVACCLCSALAGCHWTATGKNSSGTALHQQGRHYEAIAKFQEALKAEPSNADAHYNLAATYHTLGKVTGDQQMLQQSEQLYNEALNLSPDHPDCHRGLACLLVETGRAESSFTLLERWAQRSPQEIAAHTELARLYQEFGDKDSAIRHLQQAVAVDPNNRETSRAYAALASLQEQTGNYRQALTNYHRSHQLNPQQPAVSDRIAALQSSLGGFLPGATGNTRVVTTPPPVRY